MSKKKMLTCCPLQEGGITHRVVPVSPARITLWLESFTVPLLLVKHIFQWQLDRRLTERGGETERGSCGGAGRRDEEVSVAGRGETDVCETAVHAHHQMPKCHTSRIGAVWNKHADAHTHTYFLKCEQLRYYIHWHVLQHNLSFWISELAHKLL